MAERCSRCNYYAMDYCAECGEPYCENCMDAGCCGVSPAASGTEQFYEENAKAEQLARYGDLGLPMEDVTSPPP